MKLKIGTRLMAIREDRQMTQEEMADLLALSQSAYSRLERNESMLPFEDLTRVAEKLKVPVQELLPEIFTVHNNPTGHANGIIFNNIINNNYYTVDQTTQQLQIKIAELETELKVLKEGK